MSQDESKPFLDASSIAPGNPAPPATSPSPAPQGPQPPAAPPAEASRPGPPPPPPSSCSSLLLAAAPAERLPPEFKQVDRGAELAAAIREFEEETTIAEAEAETTIPKAPRLTAPMVKGGRLCAISTKRKAITEGTAIKSPKPAAVATAR